MARRAIERPPQAENFFSFCDAIIAYLLVIWVETLNSRWKQSTKHHSFTLQTGSQLSSYVFFRDSHKGLYRENSKMRFLWHCDNGKTDRISRSRYA